MKKFLSLALCLVMLTTILSSCSKPPEYAEIEERFRELVLASGEINMIFFGEGLETYERITDPKASMKVIVEEVEGEDGNTEKIYHYYYKVPDETYDSVYAYRSSYFDPYTYLCVLSSPDTSKTPFYVDETRSIYAYVLEGYKEPEYEFFYDSSDPTGYDYVRPDCKYTTVDEIKAAAAKVYSNDYLEAIYEMMFVGSVSDNEYVDGMTARYIEYADDEGNISLMKSNTSEPFISEIREFDFSTAKIIKPANAEYVNIEIVSYLPSNPDAKLAIRISMILQDGVWMLDSATY